MDVGDKATPQRRRHRSHRRQHGTLAATLASASTAAAAAARGAITLPVGSSGGAVRVQVRPGQAIRWRSSGGDGGSSSSSTREVRLAQLRRRLAADGFVHVRGALRRATARSASEEIRAFLRSCGAVAEPAAGSANETDGRGAWAVMDGCSGFSLLDRRREAEAASPSLRRLVGAAGGVGGECRLAQLVAGLLGQDAVRSVPVRWLRAVGRGQGTGAHFDRAFFELPEVEVAEEAKDDEDVSRGQAARAADGDDVDAGGGDVDLGGARMVTVWMPLMDVTPERGTLCLVPGSHERVGDLARRLAPYRGLGAGADGTRSGWLAEDPSDVDLGPSGKWVTADVYKVGDAVVLLPDLLHLTSNNQTDEWRVSCETRWVPAQDELPRFRGGWGAPAPASHTSEING
ncbi:hypothetical protein HK405_002661 [Cladochytrium tenue]|nr:hypothetical protein HK405_002661 [Cladochytrium tenue]